MIPRSLRTLVESVSRPGRPPRRRKQKGAVPFRPVVQVLEDRTLLATVFWVNPAGGDWAVPSNWSTGALPGPDDDVVIDVPGSVTVTHATGTDSVRSLTSQEDIVLSGGSLSLAAASVIENTFAITGGRLAGAGDLNVNGLLTWTSGIMADPGRTVANGGLQISGSAAKFLTNRTLDNVGTATLAGTADLNATLNATINNLSGATFLVQSDLRILGAQTTAVFNNAGTFRKTSGSGTTTLALRFNNTGTVDVQTGTLLLFNGGTHSGAFTVAAGATLVFENTPHLLTSASRVTGAGNVGFFGFDGSSTVAGVYDIGGRTTIGDRFGFPFDFTVHFEHDAQTGTLTLDSGVLAGAGTVTVTSLLTWTGGRMIGTGRTVASGGLDISSAGPKVLIERALENVGAAVWTGTGLISVLSGAMIINRAGAVFDIRNDAPLNAESFVPGSFAAFRNAGTLRKSAGTGTSTLGQSNVFLFENSGTVVVQTGTLLLRGDSDNSGTFTVAAGARLDFTNGLHALDIASFVSGPGTVGFGPVSTTVVSGGFSVGAADISGTADFRGNASTGTLSLSGILTGPGTLAVNGLLTWTGGTMSGPGRTLANGGLALSGNVSRTLSQRALDNFGLATWSGAGGITASNGAVFTNRPGATLELQNTAASFSRLTTGLPAQLTNAGTLRRSVPGTLTVQGVFNNSGMVDLQATPGTLQLEGGSTSSGTFLVGSGSDLHFVSGSFNLTASSRISGAGDVNFIAGTTTFGTGSITVAGSYQVSGATTIRGIVNFLSDVTLPALTILPGGLLGGTSTVTVNGVVTSQQGGMSGPGRTVILGDLDLTGPFGSMTLNGRTLDNAGRTTISGGGIGVSNNGTFNNLPGATFVVEVSGSIGGLGTFNNAGTLRKTGGGTLTVEARFNNTGAVNVEGGAVIFNPLGGMTSSGALAVGEGTTVEFRRGPITLTANSQVTGLGTVAFTHSIGETTVVAGTFHVGTVTITGFTGAVTFAATYDVGTTRIGNGNTVTFQADAVTRDLFLSSGVLTGPGLFTVTESLTWTGGGISGPGRTVVQGILLLDGNNMRLSNRTLDLAGTSTWTAGAGNLLLEFGAVINNLTGATFDVQNDRFINRTATATFRNAGTFRKTVGTGTTTIDVSFSNTGTVEVGSGTLFFSQGLTNFSGLTLTGGSYVVRGTLRFPGADIRTNAADLVLDGPAAQVVNQFGQDAVAKLSTITAAGSLTLSGGRQLGVTEEFLNAGLLAVLEAGSTFATTREYTQTDGVTLLAEGTLSADAVLLLGGTLAGSGTINSNVVNASQIHVGGQGMTGVLAINGFYVQTADGILAVEIGGREPGIQYDQLQVSGVVLLDGTLSVALVDEFFASKGDTFRVLESGARQGDFAAYDGLDLGGGLALVPVFDDTSLTLLAAAVA